LVQSSRLYGVSVVEGVFVFVFVFEFEGDRRGRARER